MPRLKFAAPWVFFVLAPTIAATQVTPSPPVSVTISAPSSDVKAGSELKLDVVVTNTSDEQVGLTTWPEDFRVDVLDSNGKVVGKAQEPGGSTTNRKALNFPAQGSSQGITLAPHGVFRLREDLSKEFDLSKPGKYTVQAIRMYGKTAVKSNTVTITVVP
jgi:hypothetical protein